MLEVKTLQALRTYRFTIRPALGGTIQVLKPRPAKIRENPAV